MIVLKNMLKKLIIMTIIISILISFSTIPASYAKLDIKSDEFYYAGTQKGQYVAKEGVFSWLINALAEVADWIVGAISMAIRAPFIGWTALIERLLTGALEATAGLDMDNNMSNTDLNSIIHSEKNVTVQAIVYNQVPALDINFFNTEYNKEYSPTGSTLICSKCQRPCSECVGDGGGCTGDCKCGGCDACKTYAALQDAEPLFIELRKYVAFWYFTLRLIALIGMLVLLVAIGIKIAISNVASDKAMYKRMLIDWVIGIIIILLLHYAMIFTININEILVNTVKESANSINRVKMMELAEDSSEEAEYTDNEIEIDIYEEVRTRAYDAKFVNGVIGTILYMSLVYMAIRFTLMYLKRLFIVAVLILMGPGVGFAYALQKALSGRSMALKKWLSEYIINIIIQSVHAIIYAVFISTVLVLSLKSIAGVIVAFIIMNFSLKAEDIFRKIFNLEKSSLLKETDKAGNVEERVRNAVGTYKGATAIARNVGNSFYGKGVKNAAKLSVGGLIVTASAAKNGASSLINGITAGIHEGSASANNISEASNESVDQSSAADTSSEGAIGSSTAGDGIMTKLPFIGDAIYNSRKDKELANISVEQLTNIFEKAKDEYEKNPDSDVAVGNYINAYNDLARKQELNTVTRGDAIKGHINRLLDMDNYFDLKIDKKGRKKYSLKKGALLGTSHYDTETGKTVSDKNSAIRQLGVSNLLGFTPQDSKVFKENVWKPLKNGFLGTAAMFVGLSTMAFHPAWGMGMLAYGVPNKYGSLAKLGYIPTLNNSKRYKDRKYNFKAFSTPTLKNMKDATIERMKAEQSSLNVQRIRDRHPVLFKNIRAGTVVASTLAAGPLGGVAAFTALKAYDKVASNKEKRLNRVKDSKGRPKIYDLENRMEYKIRNVSEAEDAINKQHYTQLKKQQKEFEEDALKVIAMEASLNTKKELEEYAEKEREKILEQMGYKYDRKSGNLVKIENTTSSSDLDSSSDSDSENSGNDNNINNKTTVTNNELVTTINGQEIKEVDINKINKSIDDVLAKIAGKERIDINSESKLDQIIKELNSELVKSNILIGNQSAEELFKGGRNGLVSVIKRKTKKVNRKIEAENAIFAKMNPEEASTIISAVNEELQAETEKDKKSGTSDKNSVYDRVNQSRVLDKVLKKVSAISDPSAQNGPIGSNSNNMGQNQGDSNKSPKTKTKITAEKKEQYRGAIGKYIEYRKNEENGTSVQGQRVSEEEKKDVLGKADKEVSKKKDKLQQALEVYLSSPDAGLQTLNTDEDLSSFNSSKILEQLLVMKELNERGNKLRLKGSAGYKRQVLKQSEAESDYYKDQRAVIKAEMEMGVPRDYETSLDYDSLSTEDKIKIDNIRRIKRKLPEKEAKYKNLKRQVDNAGPIVDINDVINNS